jgi:hypothetical protein
MKGEAKPTKREQLAAMRLEEFRAHPRTIAGGPSETISSAARPNPMHLSGCHEREILSRPPVIKTSSKVKLTSRLY